MTAFRHLDQAPAHQLVGGHPHDFFSFVEDAAGFGLDQPGNGVEGGGFPGSVGADQGDDFPVPHFHVQVLHGVDGPIIDIQIFNGEHQDTSSPR